MGPSLPRYCSRLNIPSTATKCVGTISKSLVIFFSQKRALFLPICFIRPFYWMERSGAAFSVSYHYRGGISGNCPAPDKQNCVFPPLFNLVLRREPACQPASQMDRQKWLWNTQKHRNNHLALQQRPALRRKTQVNMANVSGTPLIKTLIVPFL